MTLPRMVLRPCALCSTFTAPNKNLFLTSNQFIIVTRPIGINCNNSPSVRHYHINDSLQFIPFDKLPCATIVLPWCGLMMMQHAHQLIYQFLLISLCDGRVNSSWMLCLLGANVNATCIASPFLPQRAPICNSLICLFDQFVNLSGVSYSTCAIIETTTCPPVSPVVLHLAIICKTFISPLDQLIYPPSCVLCLPCNVPRPTVPINFLRGAPAPGLLRIAIFMNSRYCVSAVAHDIVGCRTVGLACVLIHAITPTTSTCYHVDCPTKVMGLQILTVRKVPVFLVFSTLSTTTHATNSTSCLRSHTAEQTTQAARYIRDNSRNLDKNHVDVEEQEQHPLLSRPPHQTALTHKDGHG